MELEVGKYYRTRDGRKVGPIELGWFGDTGSSSGESWWMGSGAKNKLHERDDDIIAEWVDKPSDTDPSSPVRTVTRKKIVPGNYGKVRVTGGMYFHVNSMSTATELRAAIKTLTEIADALEETEQ